MPGPGFGRLTAAYAAGSLFSTTTPPLVEVELEVDKVLDDRAPRHVLPGLVSVLRPVEAAPEMVGVPYMVFAGNVGGDDALAHVIDVLRGRMRKPG